MSVFSAYFSRFWVVAVAQLQGFCKLGYVSSLATKVVVVAIVIAH